MWSKISFIALYSFFYIYGSIYFELVSMPDMFLWKAWMNISHALKSQPLPIWISSRYMYALWILQKKPVFLISKSANLPLQISSSNKFLHDILELCWMFWLGKVCPTKKFEYFSQTAWLLTIISYTDILWAHHTIFVPHKHLLKPRVIYLVQSQCMSRSSLQTLDFGRNFVRDFNPY